MRYTIIFERNASKQLEKIDLTQQKIIVNWLDKNLEGTDNPRKLGKSLKGNLKNYWRYRIGAYRIIADIDDAQIKIIIIKVGHRKDIYN